MKRKLLIFSSLITLLLSVFSVPIFGEEDIEDIEELSQVDLPDYALDQYFYDNYVLLPYIESDGNQYIDTGYKGSNNLKVNLLFSNLSISSGWRGILFAQTDNSSGRLGLAIVSSNDSSDNRFYFNSDYQIYNYEFLDYNLYNFIIDKNIYRLNDINHSFNESEFVSSSNIYLFSGPNGTGLTSYRLYKFSIFDYSIGDNGEYVRFYYPAKSKSGGVIGLYDSISKTFVTTGGSVPFSSPINDQVISFQISEFLDASMDWIESVFLAIIEIPIIIVFMAIGLAGVIFRWGRRIVHF